MQSLASIKELLESRGLRASKALGQNFLIEPAHVMRLVDAAGVGAGDLVLEVGPGTGVLTDVLLDRGCRVVACELDRGLADLLRDRYADQARSGVFTLIEGDCLESKHEVNPLLVDALGGEAFRLVANLPYGAASPLMIALATHFHPVLRHGTSTAREGGSGLGDPRANPLPCGRGSTGQCAARCLGQFVTIQREVAERLRAATGTKDYGEMGVLVQAMCEVKRLAVLAPGCFWPPPKVTSEMVSVTPLENPLTNDVGALSRLCRMLFTHRRKQIGTILAREGPGLLGRLPVGVDRTMRPEQLTVQQLVAMSRL
jgi:16S rRNA (adenine1518-N6/adenine1519-N6)-dimethyltransferase